MRPYVLLFINGQRHEVSGTKAFMTLANFLRYELGLCGTKIVCAEGDCGACTVLCYRTKPESEPVLCPINACIAMVFQCDGCHVLTIESQKEQEHLSPVQEAMVRHHASQCGFCTPGVVMALSAYFERSKMVTEQGIKNALTGNLCRCTGYQPLLDAGLAVDYRKFPTLISRYLSRESHELTKNSLRQPLHIKTDDQELFAPIKIDDCVSWRSMRPSGVIMMGGTDLGVLSNKGKRKLDAILSLHLVEDLDTIKIERDRVVVGAQVTIEEVRRFTKRVVPEFARFLNIFASPQIKSMATLVGNVANASPIGDTLPFLMVCDGMVYAYGQNGLRKIPIENLVAGYKQLVLSIDEIITHVSFRIPDDGEILRLEKVSQRRDLDISTLNSAFLTNIDKKSGNIKDIRIAMGGIGPVVKRLTETEQALIGRTVSHQAMRNALSILQSEISPINDLRGSESFRRSLAQGLLSKFVAEEIFR